MPDIPIQGSPPQGKTGRPELNTPALAETPAVRGDRVEIGDAERIIPASTYSLDPRYLPQYGITLEHSTLAAAESGQPLFLLAYKDYIRTARTPYHRWTTFHIGAHNGCIPILKISHNQWPEGINLPGLGGLTPLYVAAMRGKHEAAEFLLRHGANPEAATDSGETPEAVARRYGYAPVVELFEKAQGTFPNAKSPNLR